MKSPVSGKDEHYYSNGDGTWFTESGTIYTKDDIGDRLRYEAENAGTLKQDYDTAQNNLQKHQEDWEKQSKSLSKDGEDYVKWKQAQDAAEKRQDELNKLALKHHVANPTEENIKKAIEGERKRAMDVLEWATNRDVKLSTIICGLEIVDKSAEAGIYYLGSGLGPGAGSVIKDVYTFTREVAKSGSEAVVFNKGVGHVAMGALRGATSVFQHHTGDLAKLGVPEGALGGYGRELANGAMWVGSEMVHAGIKSGVNGGNVMDDVANAGAKKLLALGIAKGVGGAAKWVSGKDNIMDLGDNMKFDQSAIGTYVSKATMNLTDTSSGGFMDSFKQAHQAAQNYKIIHS